MRQAATSRHARTAGGTYCQLSIRRSHPQADAMGRYYEITGLGTVTSVLEASSIQRCGVPEGIGSAWTTEFRGAVAA